MFIWLDHLVVLVVVVFAAAVAIILSLLYRQIDARRGIATTTKMMSALRWAVDVSHFTVSSIIVQGKVTRQCP